MNGETHWDDLNDAERVEFEARLAGFDGGWRLCVAKETSAWMAGAGWTNAWPQ